MIVAVAGQGQSQRGNIAGRARAKPIESLVAAFDHPQLTQNSLILRRWLVFASGLSTSAIGVVLQPEFAPGHTGTTTGT